MCACVLRGRRASAPDAGSNGNLCPCLYLHRSDQCLLRPTLVVMKISDLGMLLVRTA